MAENKLNQALLALRYARGGSSAPAENASMLIKNVITEIKRNKTWYLIRSAFAPIPYSVEDKAFLFTDKEIAEMAKNKLCQDAEMREGALEIYEYPLYEEDIFSLLARHGIKKICINMGQNSMTITLEKIVVGVPCNPFIRTLDSLVFTSHDEKKYDAAETMFAKKLSTCRMYYVTREDSNIFIPEPYYIDGAKQNVIYLFTDKTELRQQYLRAHVDIRSERAIKIFKMAPGVQFVINPMSSNIFVGEKNIQTCINTWDSFTKVYITARHRLGNKEQALRLAKDISKNKAVCAEYLAVSMMDNPDYPQENPIRTAAGYTAEMISDITDSATFEITYAIMSCVFAESRDSIKEAAKKAKNNLK